MQLAPDPLDFKHYSLEAEGSEKVLQASRFIDRVIDRMYGEEANNSPQTPWSVIGDRFQMRPGEVTLWAGINGHGKTLVTTHVALHLLVQNERVCIASFEMKGEATMARMVRQASGSAAPSVDYIHRFHDWTDDLLWIYDQQGLVDPETLRQVMQYCAEKLKVKHFFIDSMMKVVKGEDDYNGQKQFVHEMTTVAQDTGMHIHLIAHVRKKDDETTLPNKFDVKGSSSVTDMVDNVWIVWRNRNKEKKLSELLTARPPKPELIEEEQSKPDAVLLLAKQRHFDWEGKVKLWLKPGANSFTDAYRSKPYHWEPPQSFGRLPSLMIRGDVDEVFDGGFAEVEVGARTEPGVRGGAGQVTSGVSGVSHHVPEDW